MEYGDLRKKYRSEHLSRKELTENPLKLLEKWLQEAVESGIEEANAAFLATCSKKAVPSSRTVLLKEVDERGCLFYTNYESLKGRELAENPLASMTLYWRELDRQVTINGTVERLPREKSAAYFSGRPKKSRIGVLCSQQGEAIASRQELERRFDKLQEEYKEKEVPLPDYWGGYRLLPTLFLFWQGHDNRLHDRFKYVLQDGIWKIERISP